jgi:hypothetical protein
MRLHPIIWFLAREAGEDDVIPLAFPIETKSGAQISSIPVKKGQMINIPIAAYNRYMSTFCLFDFNYIMSLCKGIRKFGEMMLIFGDQTAFWIWINQSLSPLAFMRICTLTIIFQ